MSNIDIFLRRSCSACSSFYCFINLAKQGYCIQFVCLCMCVCLCVCVFLCVRVEVIHGTL